MDGKDIALIKALGRGGSGGSVTVDSELSDTSTNPVQNRVVKSALDALSEENAELKEEIDTVIGVKGVMPGHWINGTLSTAGALNLAQQYRVVSDVTFAFKNNTTVQIADGFRIYVWWYDSQTISSSGAVGNSGAWVQDNYTFDAEKNYSCAIARVKEDMTEVADPTEFSSALVVLYSADPLSVRMDAAESRLDDIDEATANGYRLGLPDYVVEERDNVLGRLNTLMPLGDVVVFGFNTDQHNTLGTTGENGVLYGIRALSQMTRKIPFNAVFLGGDCVGYDYDTETNVDGIVANMLQEINNCNEALYDACCPVVSLVGNHETQNTANSANPMHVAQLRNVMIKRAIINCPEIKAKDSVSCNGYWDDAASNIRWIFLHDTSYEENTAASIKPWLTQTLGSIPDGFDAIVVSHHALNTDLGADFSRPLSYQDCLNAYADKIICCVNGHAHKDGAEKRDGILYIQTTCALRSNTHDGYTRDEGTAAETAFDVFVIDRVAKQVHAVRYGAGSDRVLDY